MSSIAELLASLRQRGIQLWAEDGALHYGTDSMPPSDDEILQLRRHKNEILSLLGTKDAKPTVHAFRPAEPYAEHSLPSSAQERLWFLMQTEGANQAYNIPLCYRLVGKLEVRTVRRALDLLIERHESLRTRFRVDGRDVLQVADPPKVGFALIEVDLSAEPDPEKAVKRYILDDLATEFDLERGPVVRGSLIHLKHDDHVLLVSIHHINADGWSIGVIARDFGELYSAVRERREPNLRRLALKYRDYAAWQRREATGEHYKEHATYWRTVMEDPPEPLTLPTDYKRPDRQNFDGDVTNVEFDEQLTTALRGISRQRGMTLFMTVLAGWSLVLSRMSGQFDVTVGTPTANRIHPEVDGVVGLFVNALGLRINLGDNPSLNELLSRTRSAALEAQEHQELPFERVVELANPVRSAAHTPLFQVMLAWQNNDVIELELPGLQVTPFRVPLTTAKYDLTLDLEESHGRITGVLNYATGLFSAETASRYIVYLRNALSAISQDCTRRISTVEVMSEEERQQLVHEWSGAAVSYGPDRCIHELFEEKVRLDPDKIALVFEEENVTFRQINERANQLARYLIDRGLKPDDLVAVCMSRCPDLVVSLLAILKAGGAYVPLDPSYPVQRLAYMSWDAAPVLFLAKERFEECLPPVADRLILIDRQWSTISAYGTANVPATELGLTNRNLAYVIYTSGSTGMPKGAMNEHRGMVNRIRAQDRIEGYGDRDICSQKTSISFVDAVFETFGALCNGRPLVIIPASAVVDTERMARLISTHGVTQLTTVPSLARSMLDNRQVLDQLASLRNWTLSGEEVPPDLLAKLQRELPNCEFIILYGASEVSSDATFYKSRRFEGDRVPIGAAVPNVQVYILGENQELLPGGVVGEIHVGGIGVGRGYRGRSDMTAAQYVPDHFSADSTACLYRTGDLGRWRPSGVLECLGRRDNQVKIRGFRVEPGEIEARLATHEAVGQAVVVIRENGLGDKRLVAYVIPQLVSAPLELREMAEALRAHLKAVLPDYMVPSEFVTLPSFPTTPNGKLDRRALPIPERWDQTRGQYEVPEGRVEQYLAEIWQNLLRIERVGRRDDFFELGGHSLHLMKLIMNVADRFQIRLSVPDVFQAPTIAEMANLIELQRANRQPLSRPEHHEYEQGVL
jgi:amino acid adenylation domain-containing protein